LSPFHIWLMAARPRTLPAAAAPVLVGTAYAMWSPDDGFDRLLDIARDCFARAGNGFS